MDPNREFLEFLEIQEEPDFLNKGELLERVRELGGHISPRNLSFYTAEGLVPKSIRIGSRVGAYPASVADLLAWISRARERGVSIDAIRELIPVWRYLYRARFKDSRLDLSELEFIARQHAASTEAAWAVPFLVSGVLNCQHCNEQMTVVLKNGEEAEHGAPITVSFEMTVREAEAPVARPVATTSVTLPMAREIDGDDPRTIILGTPVGVPVDRSDPGTEQDVAMSKKPEPGG